jgi:hypothetical protein
MKSDAMMILSTVGLVDLKVVWYCLNVDGAGFAVAIQAFVIYILY